MVSRVMAALALLLALVAPSIAQGKHPDGRIAATFYQARGSAQQSKAATAPPDNVVGPFKVDPEAPIHIEADKLLIRLLPPGLRFHAVGVIDGAKQAVFSGKVALRQGDLLIRTAALTAFYLGQFGLSNGDEWRAQQLTRVEAREPVVVISRDGQTSATGDWATFDVMAHTVLMGDHVNVSHGKDVAGGPRLRIALATGKYRFEIENVPAPPQPPAQMRPQ